MLLPKRVIFNEFGNPLDVLRVEEYPVPELKADQVLVRLLAAPIHPSDIGTFMGSYGSLPPLPAVAGREGVGEIIALGENVDPSWIGENVRMPSPGAWAEALVMNVNKLFVIPNDLPIDMAAMAFINPPTAYRLLKDFAQLKPGDWIIQNAANSAVGICVIQLAKHWGFNTINIVRDGAWIDILKAYGATEVVLESDDFHKQFPAKPKLALNSVGGPVMNKLIQSLTPGGTCITFGAMSQELMRWPTRELIFNDITFRGFWLHRWYQHVTKEIVAAMFAEIYDLIRKKILSIPVEKKYPLEAIAQAITHAQQGHRSGKILIQSLAWQNLIA